MTVSGYENTIQGAFNMTGWRHMHVRPIFDGRKKRWVTPTTAKGWPDLTAIHPRWGIVCAAEVKGTKARDDKPTLEQLEWLGIWHRVPSAAAVVFRPSDDFDTVLWMLRNPDQLASGWGWLDPTEHRKPQGRTSE